MEGSSWQSMDINGNCHNSLEVHGCPRKRVDISFHKCGAERWGQTNVVVFNEPDTIASQPAPPHRPRAYRGRPRCAWSWFWRSWAIPEINDYHGWIWPPVSLCSFNYWGSVGVLGSSRGPTADPHVLLVPMRSFEKRWKAKTTHEMIHETYETIMKKNSEKLWKLMKKLQKTMEHTKNTDDNSENRTEWKSWKIHE